MSDEVRWFVGFDWASEQHHVCLLDTEGKPVAERVIRHDGAGLLELCAWLVETTGAQPQAIAVAIETPRGPIVEALLERGFEVFSINPKQLDRFRDRFSVAGAKDDSRDAHVLGHSLRTDRHAFRRLAADDPRVIELREWSRMHDELQQERNRLTNRLREQLWRYYPQALELTNDLAADWFLDVWDRVPTPAKAARVSEQAITRILKAHRVRRLDAAEALRILRQKPLWVAPGTTEAASAHIRAVAARLRLINQQIKDTERRLDELCTALEAPGQVCEQRDVAILRSCPGLGRINIATLLAEAWPPLRQRDYHVLRTLSGVAPVTRRSGKTKIVIRRYACNDRLANTVFHWARVAIQHDPYSRDRYAALRRRGHSHARALRSVGDRLLYVLCTLLEHQTLFDPAYKASRLAAAA
ncbi:MAG TPA: IS110 family transposase [Xanthobacteraceae bacterium]|nr:IS110 family transposase [Xanthobacteraceae bacterium]